MHAAAESGQPPAAPQPAPWGQIRENFAAQEAEFAEREAVVRSKAQAERAAQAGAERAHEAEQAAAKRAAAEEDEAARKRARFAEEEKERRREAALEHAAIAEREQQIAASGGAVACTTDGWSWTDGKHAYGSPSRTRVGAFRHRMGLCGHPMPAGEGIEKQFRSLLQGLIDTRGKVSRSQKTVTRFGWPFLNALVEVWRAWDGAEIELTQHEEERRHRVRVVENAKHDELQRRQREHVCTQIRAATSVTDVVTRLNGADRDAVVGHEAMLKIVRLHRNAPDIGVIATELDEALSRNEYAAAAYREACLRHRAGATVHRLRDESVREIATELMSLSPAGAMIADSVCRALHSLELRNSPAIILNKRERLGSDGRLAHFKTFELTLWARRRGWCAGWTRKLLLVESRFIAEIWKNGLDDKLSYADARLLHQKFLLVLADAELLRRYWINAAASLARVQPVDPGPLEEMRHERINGVLRGPLWKDPNDHAANSAFARKAADRLDTHALRLGRLEEVLRPSRWRRLRVELWRRVLGDAAHRKPTIVTAVFSPRGIVRSRFLEWISFRDTEVLRRDAHARSSTTAEVS